MKQEIKRTFLMLPDKEIRKLPVMIYEPRVPGRKNHIGIVLQHSDDNYFEFVPALELAARGYTVIVSYFPDPAVSLDRKLVHVGRVVDYLKSYPSVDRIVLLGHSGGATLMSAYQAVAEKGCGVFQGPEKVIAMGETGELPKADAVMFLDANLGNGVMTLLSLDPAVISEGKGVNRDPELDLYSLANGFGEECCRHSETFIKKYVKAQGERMNSLIRYARERVKAISEGEGNFLDDEPMVIPGGSQIKPYNKLFPLYPEKYFSHTKREWLLLRADGTREEMIVPCRRTVFMGQDKTDCYLAATLTTTVKTFLASSAIRVNGDFGYDETGIYGVDWDSSYCTGPGNAKYISVPMLLMGMTGSYEYIAAEQIYERAVAAGDKTLVFVEGAGHNFTPEGEAEKYPGEFGDTAARCFDFVDEWLTERF